MSAADEAAILALLDPEDYSHVEAYGARIDDDFTTNDI
jgi:hypothetical protein